MYVVHTLTHIPGRSHKNKSVFKIIRRLCEWPKETYTQGDWRDWARWAAPPPQSPVTHSAPICSFHAEWTASLPASLLGDLPAGYPAPPLASTSAGSDLWSLRGGWQSQEGNTVMIGDGGGVPKGSKERAASHPGGHLDFSLSTSLPAAHMDGQGTGQYWPCGHLHIACFEIKGFGSISALVPFPSPTESPHWEPLFPSHQPPTPQPLMAAAEASCSQVPSPT